jgi:alkaline phosphatase
MGIAHRELIRLATVGQNDDLAMNKLDYAGTFNGAIGVDLQENPVPTLPERARDAGKSTGLVTTNPAGHGPTPMIS